MVEQETGRAGKYLFKRVVGKETLELLGQLPSTQRFVPFNGGYDSPSQEVVGSLPVSCCGLADCRAYGRREGYVEQGVVRRIWVVGRQDIDGKQPIEFPAK
ncbi:hypothetical protein [Streptomyces sp. NPDC019937]|uniref:hypothetical protein n=1 Tax=Streptomyces sp. NPDC019937 TaxID=3154787 RepID=UPI0033D479C2